jgi:hypothetical protein
MQTHLQCLGGAEQAPLLVAVFAAHHLVLPPLDDVLVIRLAELLKTLDETPPLKARAFIKELLSALVLASSDTRTSTNWRVRSSAMTLTKPASSMIWMEGQTRPNRKAPHLAIVFDGVEEVAALLDVVAEHGRGLLCAAAVV